MSHPKKVCVVKRYAYGSVGILLLVAVDHIDVDTL